MSTTVGWSRTRVRLPKPPEPQEGYVSRIEPLDRQAPVIPDIVKQARPISLDNIPKTETYREPIFAKRSERAILAAAIGVQRASGAVDLEGIFDRLVQRKLIDRLPRRALPTLKFGVQLLLDRSESMLPYLQDCQALETRLRQIAGSSRFTGRWFKGSPMTRAKFQKDTGPLQLIENVRDDVAQTPTVRDRHAPASHVGERLGDTDRDRADARPGHELHGHPRQRLEHFEVVDELGQVLDGVDVVVRRR